MLKIKALAMADHTGFHDLLYDSDFEGLKQTVKDNKFVQFHRKNRELRSLNDGGGDIILVNTGNITHIGISEKDISESEAGNT